MNEQIPSAEQREATAVILKDVIKLLKVGLFQGENGESVAKAIWWLQNCANGLAEAPAEEVANVKE